MTGQRARNLDDDDGDDTSVGSRSPSPLDSMQVDDHDVYKYDEYARGYEKVTVDTKITSSNKGFGMLMELGVGRRTDPIPFHVKQDMTRSMARARG